MSTKQGVDRAGHRYKSVDGKRVAIGDKPATTGKPSDQISSYLQKVAHDAKSAGSIKGALKNALSGRFGIWLKIASKTSAGRSNRRHAVQEMMKLLHGEVTEEDKKQLEAEDANYGDIAGDLVGDDEETSGSTSAPDDSGDEAILAVVHKFGLNAEQLQHVLTESLESVHT